MQNSAELLLDRLLTGVTDVVVEDAGSYREEPGAPWAGKRHGELESEVVPTDWRDAISNTGYEFIVRWETGGKAYYDKVIKGRPIWPGYASGITIGCGYDLGYHTRNAFIEEWNQLIGAADIQRLAAVVGFRTVAPDRAAKVQRAKELVQSLSDIVVPWQTAIGQFNGVKLPTLIQQLYASLANVAQIHPHCRAALLSLVFNRGASFAAEGERFSEMRMIAAVMRDATLNELTRIPELLRAMKRIWGNESSLAKRREGEAQLFEAGLQEMALFERLVQETKILELERVVLESGELPAERHDDLQVEPSDMADDDDEATLPPFFAEGMLEFGTQSAADVRWNPKDDEQPDYRHLDRSLSKSTFELTSDDLDLLIDANEFATKPGKLLFALRGAEVASGSRADSTSIVITDQRPDHRRFRCVIGVYNRETRRLYAFPASTVPNAEYVFRCYTMAKKGTPIEQLTGNILPTGCYTYAVGTHKKGQKGEIPGVLRLSMSATGASQVLVLRSIADVCYDRFDLFPIATPADNVHPGQLSEGFSSAGCLTLPGRYASGKHTGIWSEFRHAAGFNNAADGTLFSLMLLTGLDAANAARVRTEHADAASLRRLRHGSKGIRVAALQTALGLKPDPSQLIGPITRRALAECQSKALGWADGIYSPAMDGLLGLAIYGDH